MTETWKLIPDIPGYLVSDMGNVRTLKRNNDRLLTTQRVHGYLRASLWKDGEETRRRVHQLVMLAFVGPVPEGMEVRHLDGSRDNNRLENLAYGTPKENSADRVLHGTSFWLNKTHCKGGHEFTEENTYRWLASRHCRTCARERMRVYRTKYEEAKKGQVK